MCGEVLLSITWPEIRRVRRRVEGAVVQRRARPRSSPGAGRVAMWQVAPAQGR